MPLSGAGLIEEGDVVYTLTANELTLGFKGSDPVLDGEFWAPNKRLQKQPKVKPDDSKMEVVDGVCVVTLVYVSCGCCVDAVCDAVCRPAKIPGSVCLFWSLTP